MRHFIDYYYVLVSLPEDNVEATIDTIRLLGLERFAKGVMWIEKECLGADRSILLWEPNKKLGKSSSERWQREETLAITTKDIPYERKVCLQEV